MRKLLAFSLLGVSLCVSLGDASLVTPRKLGDPERIAGLGVRATIERFKANERASAIVSGDGESCLGLYIFDAQGNCIAKDDVTAPQSSDDLTVEWFPAAAAAYSVEVRNAGIGVNQFELGIR